MGYSSNELKKRGDNMANQLHHIEKLISDITGRDYATSPGEAIEKL